MQTAKAKNSNSSKFSKTKTDDKTIVLAKSSNSSKFNNLKVKTKNIEKVRCHHCKTKDHYRKYCENFKDWLRAKGKVDVYVCEE